MKQRLHELAGRAIAASDGKQISEIALRSMADGSLRWAAFVTYDGDRCLRIVEPAPDYAPLWAKSRHATYETEEVRP